MKQTVITRTKSEAQAMPRLPNLLRTAYYLPGVDRMAVGVLFNLAAGGARSSRMG